MISLRPDGTSQGTTEIFVSAQAPQDMVEVVLRRPAETTDRPVTDIDAVDARGQRPASAHEQRLTVGEQASHDIGSPCSEIGEVARDKG
jgi:hypothetical protein